MPSYADCFLRLKGWFQISDQRNPATNNYIPETYPNGTPIGGPGWISFEVPGAMPGDVVITYDLVTIGGLLTSASSAINHPFIGIFWDLLDPGGLTYWIDVYASRSYVNKADIVTALPHQGGILTPPNPINPLGSQHLLWKNVTTYYGLPGPGNLNIPYYIRTVYPGFGVRVLVWTDTCCISETTAPPIPPIFPVPFPPPHGPPVTFPNPIPIVPGTTPPPGPIPGQPIPGLPIPGPGTTLPLAPVTPAPPTPGGPEPTDPPSGGGTTLPALPYTPAPPTPGGPPPTDPPEEPGGGKGGEPIGALDPIGGQTSPNTVGSTLPYKPYVPPTVPEPPGGSPVDPIDPIVSPVDPIAVSPVDPVTSPITLPVEPLVPVPSIPPGGNPLDPIAGPGTTPVDPVPIAINLPTQPYVPMPPPPATPKSITPVDPTPVVPPPTDPTSPTTNVVTYPTSTITPTIKPTIPGAILVTNIALPITPNVVPSLPSVTTLPGQQIQVQTPQYSYGAGGTLGHLTNTTPMSYFSAQGYGGTQVSDYPTDAAGGALDYTLRANPTDMYLIRKSVPVSAAYLLTRSADFDPAVALKNHRQLMLSLTPTQLQRMGLAGQKMFAAPSADRGVLDTTSKIGSPVRLDQLADQGFTNIKQTRGGFTKSIQGTSDQSGPPADSTALSRNLSFRGSQYNVMRPKSGLQAKREKQRSDQYSGGAGFLSNRTFELRMDRAKNIANVGNVQSIIGRNKMPMSRIRANYPINSNNIDPPSGSGIELSVVRLNINSRNSPPAFMSVLKVDTDTTNNYIIRTTLNAIDDAGVNHAQILDSTGIFSVGVVNPPTPGTYVIANMTCTPGSGSAPNIIAGGQTWQLIQLIFSLLNTEQQVIAQQVISYLPPPPGATEVVPPNRLPSGVMNSLDLINTSDFLYDGCYAVAGSDPAKWYESEPCIIFERTRADTNETATIVLKATVTSQEQLTPYRPAIELYSNSLIIANQESVAAFLRGPCSASPGWINMPGGTIHTACAGQSGTGGAGGTSAYILSSNGTQIISGPFNPGIYGGSHHCFLHFKFDPTNVANSDSTYISPNTKYRLRIYGNSPVSERNGYVIYTRGLKIPDAIGSITIDTNGYITGTIITWHCNQALKIVNITRNEEIERFSSWQDGTIFLGEQSPITTTAPMGGPTNSTYQFRPESRLTAIPGDIIRVLRPGYDNLYTSGKVVTEFTV